MPAVSPYGSWRSPISADLVASGGVSLSQVQLDGEDVYWIELRPKEGGRNVIVRRRNGDVEDITPEGLDARNMVHEYGGGDYAVDGGDVYFANFSDQRLYRQDGDGQPQPLTPAGKVRYADLVVDTSRTRLLCVREDHTGSDRDCVNQLASRSCWPQAATSTDLLA